MKAKLLHQTRCILLLCFFIVCACGKRDNIERENSDLENASITIVDGGIKKFSLDNEADFLNFQGLKSSKIDGKEYLVFYGRHAHAIYMYDYQTSSLFRKISLKKVGPNAIQGGHEFFFHTMDSIFIKTSRGVRLVNSQAEILTKRTAGSRQKNGITVISSDVPILHFDNVSKFENGRIDMTMTLFNRTGEDYERVMFDFESNQGVDEFIQTKMLINNFDEVTEIKKERRKRGEFASEIPIHFVSNDQHLYGTTPLSDSLYVFKRDGELIRTVYAGVPEVQAAAYSAYSSLLIQDKIKDGFNYFENPRQPPYHENTLISPDGKFIYRVFYHGAKPKFTEESERAVPNVFKATLILVDLDTYKLTYTDLPVDEIELKLRSSTSSFVSDEGIHFRVLDQENEDEVQFRLFKINR
ncbi:DUF4221 family protein [Roseivirga misakiensis]|uniref:DUF4221 domain-containing protein n=1 Tax=Roseivirga misakiensis TaxID=1563681 RepID=A0A1E5T366_9BACT|nr:DUF4221 family protein [Roseivirga misakiensis]OEK05820.1 hypothetical protein BFP71_06790 [Roseivirga misakiensis]